MSRKLTLLCALATALAIPAAADAAVQTDTGTQSVTASTSEALALTVATPANLGAITPDTTTLTSTDGTVNIVTLDHWALQVQGAGTGGGQLRSTQDCDDIDSGTSIGATMKLATPGAASLASLTGVTVSGGGTEVSDGALHTYATGQGPAVALPLNYTMEDPDMTKVRGGCAYDAPMALTLSGSGALSDLLAGLGI
jgi:hypothetical protein